LFCGIVHCVVAVDPEPPLVLVDAGVVVVTLVDGGLVFELVDGVELPQAARPNARATDANPNADRVFRLLPLKPCSGDINPIRGPRSIVSL
jgi:hypothetical protein